MNEVDFGSLKKKSDYEVSVKLKPVKKVTTQPRKPIYTADKKMSLDEYISKYENVIKAIHILHRNIHQKLNSVPFTMCFPFIAGIYNLKKTLSLFDYNPHYLSVCLS